ncbi:unnamed protein product [Ilex paraguariensis]|uniref:DUF4228 domain protein n=1 Tax=Ilex paraguariensis TaxID=185542 RepID=A0ABC8TM04_9AQUA
MGNYVSCTFITPIMKSSMAARVVVPGGEIRHIREPVKAAELMLDCPSFFLVNSRSLNIGKRFSALSADEDLEFGNVYIMFPMKRVNAVVTAADMAVLFMAINSPAKRISGVKVGVLPEATAVAAERRDSSPESDVVGRSGLNLSDVEGFPAPEFRHRLSMCRSKKPLLETITEEPVCSR